MLPNFCLQCKLTAGQHPIPAGWSQDRQQFLEGLSRKRAALIITHFCITLPAIAPPPYKERMVQRDHHHTRLYLPNVHSFQAIVATTVPKCLGPKPRVSTLCAQRVQDCVWQKCVPCFASPIAGLRTQQVAIHARINPAMIHACFMKAGAIQQVFLVVTVPTTNSNMISLMSHPGSGPHSQAGTGMVSPHLRQQPALPAPWQLGRGSAFLPPLRGCIDGQQLLIAGLHIVNINVRGVVHAASSMQECLCIPES